MESCRDQRGIPLLESLGQDLRFALSMIRKNPSLSVVVVLSLALGIGANTHVIARLKPECGLRQAQALGLARVLATLRFGVKPHDALSFAIVAMILLAVSLLASFLPARRAAGVDPMSALRCE